MSHGWRNPPTPLGVTRRLRTFSSPSSSPPLGVANSTHTHPCRELPQASEDHKKHPRTQIGVRGSPERDISSLGAMGEGPGAFPEFWKIPKFVCVFSLF